MQRGVVGFLNRGPEFASTLGTRPPGLESSPDFSYAGHEGRIESIDGESWTGRPPEVRLRSGTLCRAEFVWGSSEPHTALAGGFSMGSCRARPAQPWE